MPRGKTTIRLQKTSKGTRMEVYMKQGIKSHLVITKDINRVKSKGRSKKIEEKKYQKLGTHKDSFINFLGSYRGIIEFFENTINKNIFSTNQQKQKLLKSLPKKQEGEYEQYFLNEKDTERYWKLNIQDEMLFVSKSLLPESFLITLISKYEYFFTNLLRVIYNEFPTKLENEIKVSLESLGKWNTLDDIKKSIINNNIDSIMYSSTQEQINTFFSLIDVDINSISDKNILQGDLIKLTLDRNVIVHSDGYVSETYLFQCKKNGIESKKTLNEFIKIDKNYLLNACDTIHYVAIKLFYLVWIKCYNTKEDIKTLYNTLNNEIFDLLVNSNFILAEQICTFIKNTFNKKIKVPNDIRLMILVNTALTYKMLGDKNSCQRILDEEDWSAVEDLFKFAYLILCENREEAANLMNKVITKRGESDKIGEDDIQERPLFFEFKYTPQFLNKYKKIFKKDFLQIIEESK